MTDHDENVPPDEIDTGEPVREIATLSSAPPPLFLARVRGKIHRRTLGSQVVQYVWFAPMLVVLEYLKVSLEALFGGSKEPGGRDG